MIVMAQFCLSVTLELAPPSDFAGPPGLSSLGGFSQLLVPQQEAATETFSGDATWVKTFIELLSFTHFVSLSPFKSISV